MKYIKWKTQLYITLSDNGVDIKARNTIRICEHFRENHNFNVRR